METMEFTPLFADSVSYWERKRVIYNVVLAVLVIACWGAELLAADVRAWFGAGLVLFIFAVAANALYCLAYPVDLVRLSFKCSVSAVSKIIAAL